jgi:LAO/AO transport system kinase
MKLFYAYMLRCSDGSYYVGHTDDLEVRMAQHTQSTTGYTAARKPCDLVWQGGFESREKALAFELQIKGWSRAKKQALIEGDWARIQQLARPKTAMCPALPTGLRQAQPERSGGR